MMAVATTAVYVLVGKLSLMLATFHPSASPVWPPTGLALAVLLLFGVRFWPSIVLGAFLVNVTTEGSVATSIAIAGGNALEAVIGCILVERFAGGIKAFERVNSVMMFVVLAAFLSTLVSATIGVSALALGGFAPWADFPRVWFTWWLGDVAGALVVAPLIILWSQTERRFSSTQETLEVFCLFVFLVFIAGIVFYSGYFPYTFITLMPILLIVIRLTPRSAITAVALLSCIAISGTIRGTGPFATHVSNTSLLFLQAYVAIASFMAMTFAASQHERKIFAESLEYKVKERTRELALARDEDRAKLQQLKNIISQMTVATIAADEHLTILHANEQFHKIFEPYVDSPSQSSLLTIFTAAKDAFDDPEFSMANLLRMLGERRQAVNQEFVLKNGITLACDYTPIFDEGVHRGHLLVFHQKTQ